MRTFDAFIAIIASACSTILFLFALYNFLYLGQLDYATFYMVWSSFMFLQAQASARKAGLDERDDQKAEDW